MSEAIQFGLFDHLAHSHHDPRGEDSPYHWIHFGTSTWAYPGWVGLVYTKKHKNTTDYLREYLEYPHFTTAGADFTFYSPPDPGLLATWKKLLPPTFKFVFKVWDELTVDRFAKVDEQQSQRRRAGQDNPAYLHSEVFEETFLAPFRMARFEKHVACLMFEFRSSTAKNPDRFLDRLEAFLSNLPKDFNYAIEVREPKLLGDRYFSILERSGVSHVFNHWDRMPALSEQTGERGIVGPQLISRVLTPLQMPYAEAKRKFAPYNQLRPENVLPRMRDDVVSLALQAIRHRIPGYVLVNNRSEGCAPLTIQALEKRLESSLGMRD
jgi:uncharacterized protein YecE (DUF72 family)